MTSLTPSSLLFLLAYNASPVVADFLLDKFDESHVLDRADILVYGLSEAPVSILDAWRIRWGSFVQAWGDVQGLDRPLSATRRAIKVFTGSGRGELIASIRPRLIEYVAGHCFGWNEEMNVDLALAQLDACTDEEIQYLAQAGYKGLARFDAARVYPEVRTWPRYEPSY